MREEHDGKRRRGDRRSSSRTLPQDSAVARQDGGKDQSHLRRRHTVRAGRRAGPTSPRCRCSRSNRTRATERAAADDRDAGPPSRRRPMARVRHAVIYRFGRLHARSRPRSGSSTRATLVPLSPKIIDLLLYLVARPSVLVSKEELFKALWPDVAVTDNALTQAVSELRQALGDDASSPAYVQTVARRGYRFIAAVHHGDGEPPCRSRAAERRQKSAGAARPADDRRAGLRQRERRSRDGVAVVRASPRR